MKFIRIHFIVLILLITHAAVAQEIKFDKKSGAFSTPAGVIAKLEDEKVKGLGGKNFYLKDAGGTELMAYILRKWEDTLGHEPVYYYEMRSTPLGLSAYRPNFTGMLNTFREVGETILAKNLLQADGKLAETAARLYFDAARAESGDYPAVLKARNDSAAALTAIAATPVERDMRKPVTANEYGKIGQGNAVIGTWEYIECKGEGLNSATHHFLVRNMAGGIVAISWIRLSGAHTYVFRNGVRSKEDWKVVDLVNNNPLDNKQAYVASLATYLIKAGLL